MNDIDGFVSRLGDMPMVSDADVVRRKSRDMSTAFSPIMRREALGRYADLIVQPRDKDDVIAIAKAAAQARMPLMMRGAGTCNLGQGVPLHGGAIIDMTTMNQVLWTRDHKVRAQAGARLGAIDEVTRQSGWELRMHSSTRKAATIAGYIGGGHAGIGSCAYGILRDRGNILGLEMISVEEEPRVVELRGDDVNLVHHAYGTNGIISEVEMPLAPAWRWIEGISVFPDFMTAARLGYALASSDGIVKKLISMDDSPNWPYMTAMRPYGRDGWSMVRTMVAAHCMEAFRALVKDFGGELTCEADEGQGPYKAPLYEFCWGHARLQVNKERADIVNNIGLYLDPDLLPAVERSHVRFKSLGGMHLEAKRYDGKIAFQGSPYYSFVNEEQVADVIRGMTEDGAMVANNHTVYVKENGMKSVGARDLAFKREMDPYNLMNPGKVSLDGDEAEGEGAGTQLPTTGWAYDSQGAGQAQGRPVAESL